MAVILIVDDDPMVRMMATELLREDAHAVIEAEDGVEALRLAAAVEVDLVVLDMLMPNKDGLECIRELRALKPDLPILAMSSGGRMGASDLLRLASVFGANETLVKPLRMATFLDAVNRLLAAKAPPPTTIEWGKV